MRLTVMERLNLPMLYPQESSLENQVLVKQMVEKTSLTEEEIKKINGRTEKRDVICHKCKEVIKEAEPGFFWDDDKYEKDIDFSKAELILLKAQVDKLNEANLITQDVLSLCLKVSSLFPKEESK